MYLVDKKGNRRKAVKAICKICGKEYLTRKTWAMSGRSKFCSKTCMGLSFRQRKHLICAYCGKEFERKFSQTICSKSDLQFCSRKCKDEAQRIENGFFEMHPPHYGNGKASYREKAFRNHGAKCENCGYDEYEIALDVHHIDEDRENNNLENLIVLCANCHARVTRRAAKVIDRKLIKNGPVA